MPSRAPSSSARAKGTPVWASRAFIAGMLLVCIGLGLGLGAWALLNYSKRQAIALWEHRLSAIADNRKAAVEAWLEGNLADARVIAAYQTTVGLLSGTISKEPAPGEQLTTEHLEGLLSRSAELKKYSGVYIVDEQARTLVQSKASSNLGPECLSLIERALEGGEPKVLPFHPNARGIVTVSFFAPVFEAGGVNPAAVLGGVVIEIVPDVWLYPFLRSQPSPMATTETLLVEREGDRIVYASPLRFRKDPPLTLSLPLETTFSAAKSALLGIETFGSYKDYRGVPVFASTRLTKKAKWGLVAKVDQSEALQDYWRFRLWVLAFTALILITTAASILTLLYRMRLRYSNDMAQGDKRYRELVESLDDVVYSVGTDGLISYISPAVKPLLSYDPKELVGKPFTAAIHPEDRNILGEAFREIPGGRLLPREYRMLNEAGEVRWVRTSIKPTLDCGQAVGLHGVLYDVTERKKAEEALEESEERYRQLFDRNLAGVYRSTVEGRILECNDAFARIYGYGSSEEALQHPAVEFHPNPEARQNFIAALKLNGTLMGYESQGHRKDGALIWVLENVTLVPDEKGNLTEMEGTLVDITERKQAEEALLASKVIIEGIVNAIPVRVFWKDKDLVYLGCNAVFAHDAGFTDPQDIIGKDDFQMGWREQAELYRGDDRDVIESGSSKYLVEEPQTTPDGKTITLLTSKMPLRDSKGEIIGLLGTYMDITERKQAEAALQQSEERLRFTLNAVRSVAYDLDLESGVLTETGPVAELFGQPNGFRHPNTASLIESIHPEDRAMVKDRLASAERGESSYQVEYRTLTQSGEARWIMASGDLLRDEAGKPLRHVGIAQDITDRKRADEALRESEAHFRSVAQSANDAIITSDSSGRIVTWNPGAEHMFGHLESEVLGQSLALLMPASYRPLHEAGLLRFLETGEKRVIGRTIELVGVRKGGAEFPVELSLAAWESQKNRFFTGILRDITERKRAEEDLKAQAARLEVLNEELQRFNRLAVGRESRMIELKRQMNEMAAKHGEPPPFPLDFMKDEEAKPKR